MDGRLHACLRRGDVEGARSLLEAGAGPNTVDRHGDTPLACAIGADSRGAESVRLLLKHGAEIGPLEVPDKPQIPPPPWTPEMLAASPAMLAAVSQKTNLEIALAAGDPDILKALIDGGADILTTAPNGYDALLHAVHGRMIERDVRLVEFLRLLVSHGVPLNGRSEYEETAVRVLAHRGRFDAVRLLLDAGGDPASLGWTPLHRAAAIGGEADIRRALEEGIPIEALDSWERTAFLVAVAAGNVPNAALLREKGADFLAKGRCGQTAAQVAVQAHRPEMLRWLAGQGIDLEAPDEFNRWALIDAVYHDCAECVSVLLDSGSSAQRSRPWLQPEGMPKFTTGPELPFEGVQTPLANASSRVVALKLLEAGADPALLTGEARRSLAGLPPEQDARRLDATNAEFDRARGPRFGTTNPEPMDEPFWIAMIRAGVNGYQGNEHYGGPSSIEAGPVWCADRFGQSLTILPDGRSVLIGGEHEDHYDADFHIYNDVIVCGPDGSLRIYGYPKKVFSPTDFHTATLVGDSIYVIGCLGYLAQRRSGVTPVCRLDLRTFRMEKLETRGEPPGWISEHRATLVAPRRIRVEGGQRHVLSKGEADLVPHEGAHVLDLDTLTWRPD